MIRELLVLVGLLALPISDSMACVCSKGPGPRKALRQAEAVCIGRVGVVEEGFVYFRVTQAWKGVPRESRYFEVFTPHPNACGFLFELDEEYVVYATSGQPKNWVSASGFPFGPQGFLIVSACSRTRRATDGAENIRKFGPPAWRDDSPSPSRAAPGGTSETSAASPSLPSPARFLHWSHETSTQSCSADCRQGSSRTSPSGISAWATFLLAATF